MKLDKKKRLAAAALKVGLGRIILNPSRIDDIKEAITKQDMRELFKEGAIGIKTVTGRHRKQKRGRRRQGKIKKKLKEGKRGYILRVRKLRRYLSMMRLKKEITNEQYRKLRNYIRAGMLKDVKHILIAKENEL